MGISLEQYRARIGCFVQHKVKEKRLGGSHSGPLLLHVLAEADCFSQQKIDSLGRKHLVEEKTPIGVKEKRTCLLVGIWITVWMIWICVSQEGPVRVDDLIMLVTMSPLQQRRAEAQQDNLAAWLLVGISCIWSVLHHVHKTVVWMIQICVSQQCPVRVDDLIMLVTMALLQQQATEAQQDGGAWMSSLILLCGDVELNPGPKEGETKVQIGLPVHEITGQVISHVLHDPDKWLPCLWVNL